MANLTPKPKSLFPPIITITYDFTLDANKWVEFIVLGFPG